MHLVESAYGPRLWPASKMLSDRPRKIDPWPQFPNGSITYAAISNPNFVKGCEIPRYAAIRFTNCVSPDKASRILAQVQALREVGHCPP